MDRYFHFEMITHDHFNISLGGKKTGGNQKELIIMLQASKRIISACRPQPRRLCPCATGREGHGEGLGSVVNLWAKQTRDSQKSGGMNRNERGVSVSPKFRIRERKGVGRNELPPTPPPGRAVWEGGGLQIRIQPCTPFARIVWHSLGDRGVGLVGKDCLEKKRGRGCVGCTHLFLCHLNYASLFFKKRHTR